MCSLLGGISEEQDIFWMQDKHKISQDFLVVTHTNCLVPSA